MSWSVFRGAVLSRVCEFSTIRNVPCFHAVIATRMSSTMCQEDHKVVPKEEVIRFIEECMRKAGTTPEDAHTVAHHLMTADYRGHFSHGMNRMQMYVKDIENKITDPAARPRIVTDFQAIAVVDGENALGQVVGKYCVELAIEKAKKFGISMVSARGSNHYGICGYYTKIAMDQGMIGFTCTNTSPLMAPTRSAKAGLGTNPLSLGMAACDGDEFLLDMATTAVALGKIELAIQKNENIPEGWALGSDGKVTRNAEEAYKAAMLMPLGGTEKNSGYKGYGLGLMVEILCGILAGSEFGPNIRSWKTGDKVANLGHCFIVINPEAFTPGSKERLSTLLGQLRSLPTAGDNPILVAGDPERQHMQKVDREGGITYHPNQLKISEEFAKHMSVQPMKLVRRSA
ncbi:hypothetical protein DMN91_005306 [Ooceraea biroi]|uniref:Malate dehydrogenase n=1 Tax=Ooceraea biroi TaxID=2015173 RepID=A0A026W283_OOCBI|nr:uncharacterized protein LOC105284926 [Ooceraea biroi]EZA49144.1 Malate dehydrogenase [Ooceraea biroi]RLU23028.1 hypothetical protein DMN91_005306 [Ooceraea biroi]